MEALKELIAAGAVKEAKTNFWGRSSKAEGFVIKTRRNDREQERRNDRVCTVQPHDSWTVT